MLESNLRKAVGDSNVYPIMPGVVVIGRCFNLNLGSFTTTELAIHQPLLQEAMRNLADDVQIIIGAFRNERFQRLSLKQRIRLNLWNISRLDLFCKVEKNFGLLKLERSSCWLAMSINEHVERQRIVG